MLLALLALLAPSAAAAQDVPVGGEFQVNTYTTNAQREPSTSADETGNFVVVWHSDGSSGSDGSGYSIQSRRFAADGLPLGDDVQVNTLTDGDQRDAVVGVTPDGRFVIAWRTADVFARRFAADGTPLSDDVQLNTYTTGNQRGPAIAVGDAGDFVVVWHSDGSAGSDLSGYSIQARRFAADGSPLGSEFEVNSYTTGDQRLPSIARFPGGEFVVVWQSDGSAGSDTDGFSIQGQRFGADGTANGSQFQVNLFTSGAQAVPSTAAIPGGEFVVAWQSYGSAGSDSSSYSVQGRLFASDGTPLTSEFQLNSYTSGAQFTPRVASLPQGGFVVTWSSYGSTGSDVGESPSVQVRSFSGDGSPGAEEVQVNTYTPLGQRQSSIAVDSEGDFVIVWRSNGSSDTDTDSFSIQGQRFLSPSIFEDGFESGDTSSWGNSVP